MSSKSEGPIFAAQPAALTLSVSLYLMNVIIPQHRRNNDAGADRTMQAALTPRRSGHGDPTREAEAETPRP